MELRKVEKEVICQISLNLIDSEDDVPLITGNTGVFHDISGFDSLRAIEVLVALETVYDREFPPDRVFLKKPATETAVSDIAKAIINIVNET